MSTTVATHPVIPFWSGGMHWAFESELGFFPLQDLPCVKTAYFAVMYRMRRSFSEVFVTVRRVRFLS